jgi:O-antigen/teichoic acid export membrane protein
MTTDAGIYALAFNIAFLVALPRTAVNALFAPAISGLFVRKDLAALQALATQTAVWTLLGAACIALPLALLAEPLLGWFGPDFTAGASALRWLLLGQVVAAGAGSQLYLLTMTGHEYSAAVLMLLNAAVNATLCAVLIHFFGLTGAALGSAISLILWNAAMAVLIWRLLHLVPSALAVFSHSARRACGNDR